MVHQYKTILRFAVFSLIISLALFSFSPGVFADDQSFDSSDDSYLQSGSPNLNNGSEVVMDLNNTRDGVVKFDINAIPSGSTITSATLTLVATGVGSASAVKNYGAHLILTDWDESTVTWNTPGSTAGTHFASSPTETIAITDIGSYNWNVTSDVTNFVNSSAINYGWRIIWSSNTSGTSKQVDFGTKENSTSGNRPVLSVTYTPPVSSHTITASAGLNGSISPSGAVSVNDGDNQSFTITTDDNYHIADVLVDSVSVGAVTSYDFTNVIGDHTIAASFGINTYTLIYNAGANGSITGTSPQTLDFGSDGTAVTAMPADGYHFLNWSDDSTANPRTDTNVSANISVTANFEANPVITPTQHTLTTSASTGGTISPDSGPYDDGTEVSITAIANAGYSFTSWSGDLSGLTNPSTITVDADKSVTANFEANQVPPTPTPAPSGGGGGGGGTVPGKVIFSGYAYPKSTIEVLRKSIADESYLQVPSESIKISDGGFFSISYIGLVNADYLFALLIKDKDGRSTSILAFNISLSGGLSEVKDILAPPTIGFEKASIVKNEVMKILGYATPDNMVELEIDGSKYKKTKADQSGFWSFDVDTTYLAYGEHSVRARQITSDAKQSNFSLTRVFKLSNLVVPKADLNSDGVIDISDWSIFLSKWDSKDSILRLQDDINGDGEVNVFDFSLFLQAIKI